MDTWGHLVQSFTKDSEFHDFFAFYVVWTVISYISSDQTPLMFTSKCDSMIMNTVIVHILLISSELWSQFSLFLSNFVIIQFLSSWMCWMMTCNWAKEGLWSSVSSECFCHRIWIFFNFLSVRLSSWHSKTTLYSSMNLDGKNLIIIVQKHSICW